MAQLGSVWSWFSRLVLGAETEAEERAAEKRFRMTMNGSGPEPSLSPEDLEAELDRILESVEDAAASLQTVVPPESRHSKPSRPSKPDGPANREQCA